MAEVKIVINDVKSGKSYQKPFPADEFIGKKLNEKINGNMVGLDGYELVITGGSDDAGFPMRADIQGSLRKKALLSSGTGVKSVIEGHKGIRVKKSVRGNTVSNNTAQINVKITKYGSKSVEECLGIKQKEVPAEDKPEAKQENEPEPTEAKPIEALA